MFSGKKPTVLIVDDTPTNIQMLAGVLEKSYQIKIATDGNKAVEIAVLQAPDLILLDIVMPDMDGYAVCKKLKEDSATSHIPVIFVTAKDDISDQMRGFNMGAVDYITKPFEPPIVRARVKTHINLKLRTEMLEKLAMIDGLTGVPNRRNFDEKLKAECGRAMAEHSHVSVIMVDIDYFKAYNDNYGHGAGDECLAAVARQLQKTVVRENDFIARYGGEEFVFIIPNANGQGAEGIAHRVRAAIEELNIPHGFSPVSNRVTVSVGCATLLITQDDDCAKLLQTADRLLYNAKESGRNRAICCTAWDA